MRTNDQQSLEAIKIRRNIAVSFIFVLITAGTIVFHRLEHWSWIDSFYYIVATSATVGYGDITPATEMGKLIASIYILTIVPIILYSFTTVAEIYFQRRASTRTQKKANSPDYKKIHE